jgi:hypothetical protein
VQLHQQWRPEAALEVLQAELVAASRAAEGQYLFPSPEKAVRHHYHHQERPLGPRLDLKARHQPNSQCIGSKFSNKKHSIQ